MEARKILIALSIICDGDWYKIYNSIANNDFPDDKQIEMLNATLKSKAVTILDDNYPNHLKSCFRPPFVLFYQGDLSLIETMENRLGVVGSREPTPIYSSKCREIVNNLNKDIVIISGVAKGIDAVAHHSAIESNKKTVGIIGCGLDVVYPLENKRLYEEIKRKGLLISEYPPGSRPDSNHFPMRNRLISFLSKGIFVPQAYQQSGSLITVGYALDQGKDVYCLPSDEFGKSACNMLIKDGADLVETADDIMYYFR